MDKLAALRRLPMFHHADPKLVAPLLDHFVIRRFARGDTLWREGAPAHNFSFMIEGRIKIVKYRPDGGETILGVFDDGDAVGQIAVFRRMPYPASAIALHETICLEIFRDHFFATLQKNGPLLEALIQGMLERNYHLVRRVEELTASSAEKRLAMLFEKFAEKMGDARTGADGEPQIFIRIALSRKELAEMINVRVETAIRLMSRWNREGPILTQADGFLVTDPDRLASIAIGEED